jgi:hypothetical protein
MVLIVSTAIIIRPKGPKAAFNEGPKAFAPADNTWKLPAPEDAIALIAFSAVPKSNNFPIPGILSRPLRIFPPIPTFVSILLASESCSSRVDWMLLLVLSASSNSSFIF